MWDRLPVDTAYILSSLQNKGRPRFHGVVVGRTPKRETGVVIAPMGCRDREKIRLIWT